MATQTNGRIAVFGVDGTLLRGDCLWLVVRSSKGPLGQLLATLDCMPWLIGWQLRLVSTERMKQHTIVAFGLCEAVNRVEASIRTDWLLGELLPHLRPEALQRLRWHQRRGDRVLLCSASPRPLLQPLAEWLGVELLCTDLQQSDGRWLPLLASPNCKGPEKVRRLEQHLGPLAGLPIEAYSYSKSDRDLLKAATIPHYSPASCGAGPPGLRTAGHVEPGRAIASPIAEPVAIDRPGVAGGHAELWISLQSLEAAPPRG